jgi:adenosylcobinamide-GDP ribazoletransferase
VLLGVRREARLLMVAIQFLTRLPTPNFPGFQPQWLARSARYFPSVGVLVGAINVLVWWLARRVFPTSVAVGLMLAASLLVTGAFHEDGFADTCDGFGGGATREQVLAIMKDSRIGAYGALGIFMLLGLKWCVLVAVPGFAFMLVVVSAHMMSRWCATGVIWRLHYQRFAQDAKAKPLADSLSGGEWLASGLIGVVALGAFVVTVEGSPLTAWTAAAPALAAGVLAAAAIALVGAAYCRHRIGGYTGDCLGAVQQCSELGFYLAALAMLRRA